MRTFLRGAMCCFLLLLFGCPRPDPPQQVRQPFIISGDLTISTGPTGSYEGTFVLSKTGGEVNKVFTLPTAFQDALRTQNTPAFLVSLVESELKVTETLEADWAANTGNSNVDWTSSPPAAGDVILTGLTGGVWSVEHDGTGTAPAARYGHSVVYYNGFIYLFGGFTTVRAQDLWKYDIANGTWSQITTATGTPPSARLLHHAEIISGKMYVFGGSTGSSVSATDCFEYDIAGNAWTTKTSDSVARERGVSWVYNGKMYVATGWQAASSTRLNDVRAYDPVGNSWAQKHSGAGTAPAIRYGAAATVVDTKVVLYGGQGTGSYYQDTYVYDLTADTWAAKANGPTLKAHHGAYTYNGAAYFYAGNNYLGTTLNELHHYRIVDDAWTTDTSGGSTRHAFGTCIYDPTTDKAYAFGGGYGTVYAGSGKRNIIDEVANGYSTSGYIITDEMDLGAVPTVNGEWRFIYTIPANTSITFEAWGSATGAFAGEETSIGTVTDGQAITQLFRYYKVKATLTATSTKVATPTLSEISAVFPTTMVVSTHSRLGFEPAVTDVGSLQTTIDTFNPSTVGQISVKLGLTKNVSSWLKSKYPRNKECRIYIGFDAAGFTQADFVEYYRGYIEDWSLLPDSTVSLKLRDFSKNWKGVTVSGSAAPCVWQSSADDKTWTAQHPVDILKEILTGYVGLADKYLDLTSFDVVKAATSTWTVTRTLTDKPFDAKDLAEELRLLLSSNFIPKNNGKIAMKRWSASEAEVLTLTDAEMMDVRYDGNSGSLINKTHIYYNLLSDDTGRSGTISVDVNGDTTSITNWGETKLKVVKDYWTPTAKGTQVTDLSNAIVARYKNIPDILSFNLDIKELGLEVGDIVKITTRMAPSTDLLGIADVKYQVVNKNLDWDKHRLSFKVLRVA